MDLSQLSTADLKALESGDLSKVSTLGLKTLEGQSSGLGDYASAAWEGAKNGLTAGFGDELQAGMAAGYVGANNLARKAAGLAGYPSLVQGSDISIGDAYTQALDLNRADMNAAKENNPAAYWTGNVGSQVVGALGFGGLDAAKGLANWVRAGNFGARTGKAAAIGAVSGGVTGFGEGEGFTDSLENAGTYAAGGAVLGAAIPAAIAGVKAVPAAYGVLKDAAANPVKAFSDTTGKISSLTDQAASYFSGKLNRADLPEELQSLPDADALFLKSLKDEGISPREAAVSYVQGMRQGATPSISVTSNVPSMQTQAYLTSRGSAGSKVAAQAIKSIDTEQIPKLNEKIIQQATGGKVLGAEEYGNTVSQAAKTLFDTKIAQRQAKAAPYYEKAFNAPAITSERIGQFVAAPEMQSGIARGMKIQRLEATAKGEKFDPQAYGITDFNEAGDPIISGVPNMRLLDAGKRGLDAMIQDNTNEFGKVNELGRALTQFKSSLLNEVDKANPDYKRARQLFSDDSTVIQKLRESPLGKMATLADGNLSKISAEIMTKDPAYISKFVSDLGNAGADGQKMRDSLAGAFLKRQLEESANSGRRFSDAVFRSEGNSQRLKALVGEDRFKQMAKIDSVIDDLLKTRNIPSQSITAAAQTVKEGLDAEIPTSVGGVLSAVRKKIKPSLFEMVQKNPEQAARYNELLFTDEGYKLLRKVSKNKAVTPNEVRDIGKFVNSPSMMEKLTQGLKNAASDETGAIGDFSPKIEFNNGQKLTAPQNGVSIFDNGKGDVSIIKGGKDIVGGIRYETKDGMVQIKRSDVKEAGKGIGTEAYKQFIDHKLSQGLTVGSDADVSLPAQKIYDKLKALGYEIEESPKSKSGYQYKKSTLSDEDRRVQRARAWANDKKVTYNPEGDPVYVVKGKK